MFHAKRLMRDERRVKRVRSRPASRPGRLRDWLRKSGVIVRRNGVRLFG